MLLVISNNKKQSPFHSARVSIQIPGALNLVRFNERLDEWVDDSTSDCENEWMVQRMSGRFDEGMDE